MATKTDPRTQSEKSLLNMNSFDSMAPDKKVKTQMKTELLEKIRNYFSKLYEAGETPESDKHFDFHAVLHREKTTTPSNAYLHFDSDYNLKIGVKVTELQQFFDATDNDHQVSLQPDFSSNSIEILQVLATLSSESRLEFIPKCEPALFGDPNQRFKKAEAYILNGPRNFVVFGRELFCGEKYTIQVERSQKAHEVISKHPKKSSGYMITHKIIFRTSEPKGLVPSKIQNNLFLFSQLMGFARGANTSTCLTAFLGDRDNAESLYLGGGKVTALPHPESWHDIGVGPMQSLFDGFLLMRENKKWKRGLSEAILWYKAANKPGNDLEASIILAQSALEALAYAHLTYDLKLREGFVIKLNASDKIDILLASLGIKEDPLKHANVFKKICKKNNFPERSCERMVNFRNRLVHAKTVEYDGQAAREALRAYLWIIETVILVRLGYKGEYQDQRIISGWRGANRASTPGVE